MNKSYKAASSVGTVALVLSGSVMSAAPAFDNWTVTNGAISSGSCTGYTCGSALTDLGFFQRMITSGSETFFQTIITENDANASNSAALDTLKFADESFVRTGNTNGIADKQRIYEERFNTGTTGATTLFRASTTLNSGWAGNNLKLTQYLKDNADDFQTDFIFAQKGLNASPTAQGMKITAYVPIQGNDDQDFVLVQLKGDYTDTAGPAQISGVGTMSWAVDNSANSTSGVNGDSIKAIWVGQNLNEIVGQVFGFTSYDNLTTTASDGVATFSLTNMSPVGWNTAVWGDLGTQTVTDPFTPFPGP